MSGMNSELYHAVIDDNIDGYKEIDGSLNVADQRTPTNNTVLHLACLYGSINCVEEILRVYESLVFKINSRGETAFHLAARQGHYKVVVALVDKAKSLQNDLPHTSSIAVQNLIRCPDLELETALHAAVRYNHKHVVDLIVTEDPSYPHPRNKQNETPLYLATIKGYTYIVRMILDKCKSPTFGGPDGRTALHAALMNSAGDENGVKLLLRMNQNPVNLSDDLIKLTESCGWANSSYSEIVKCLIGANKDLIKVPDNYGWTAFHYAAYNDLGGAVVDLVSIDKSVGYLIDIENKRTALHIAAYKGNHGVLMTLVRYFPDALEIADKNGKNILHLAVEKNRRQVIHFILSLSFEVSNNLLIQRDNHGNTPLHLIAEMGYYFEQLNNLRETVDWDVLNHKNISPLGVLQVNDIDLADQPIVRKILNRNVVKRNWEMWHYHKKLNIDNPSDIEKFNEEEIKENRGMIGTHMIVAALITTVALTAGFAMPGGFDGNEGPTQGSAILLRKTAFETFIVTDTLALLFSISSIFLYFVAALIKIDGNQVAYMLTICALLNLVSIIAMMLAFISGTYAVLANSSALAVTVSVISSMFILLFIYVCIKLFRVLKKITLSIFV